MQAANRRSRSAPLSKFCTKLKVNNLTLCGIKNKVLNVLEKDFYTFAMETKASHFCWPSKLKHTSCLMFFFTLIHRLASEPRQTPGHTRFPICFCLLSGIITCTLQRMTCRTKGPLHVNHWIKVRGSLDIIVGFGPVTLETPHRVSIMKLDEWKGRLKGWSLIVPPVCLPCQRNRMMVQKHTSRPPYRTVEWNKRLWWQAGVPAPFEADPPTSCQGAEPQRVCITLNWCNRPGGKGAHNGRNQSNRGQRLSFTGQYQSVKSVNRQSVRLQAH